MGKTGSLRVIVEQTDIWANVFTGWVQQNNGTRILNIWTGELPVASFPIQPRLHRIQTNMEILEYLLFYLSYKSQNCINPAIYLSHSYTQLSIADENHQ